MSANHSVRKPVTGALIERSEWAVPNESSVAWVVILSLTMPPATMGLLSFTVSIAFHEEPGCGYQCHFGD